MEIGIRFDISQAKIGFENLREAFGKAIEAGIEKTAEQLLKDCRPYVPMLTGALRDSGHVVALQNYAFRLVWDAANIKNGYVYAQRQYEEVFQHVDGRYAAMWVENVLGANPGRYTYLASRFVQTEIEKELT